MVFGQGAQAEAWNKGLTQDRDSRLKYDRPTTFKRGNQVNLGHKHTEGTKLKISLSKTGKVAWNKGKPAIWAKDLPQSFKNKKQVGEDHWNWQGGITPENEQARKIKAYDVWRFSVYKNNKFACVDCKTKGVQLHAHHLKSFAKNKELRYDVKNGITLCRECHIKRHTKEV